MNQEEFSKGFIMLSKFFNELAVQEIQKREEKVVKEALQSSIDKKKKAYDEFHKFVRSL
ncbi:hypothetical protein [Limosilactobacillus fermentum]|uniref:hypothetical protein n=1 Tax=Limosilactobacillus fermentum TaxID=1613 RepID=UPI0021C0BB25|nr:hypothetical protein [Limosilactobacillus fermentum]